MSSVPYELIVAEDLRLGTSDVEVTMPAGGTATGHAINMATFQALTAGAAALGTQSIPASTTTTVEYPTELFDTKGWYNPATFKFTPMKSGYYLVTGSIILASFTGTVTLGIYQNTSAVIDAAEAVRTAATARVQVSAVVAMNGSTDTLEMRVVQTDAAAKVITGGRFTITCMGGL